MTEIATVALLKARIAELESQIAGPSGSMPAVPWQASWDGIVKAGGVYLTRNGETVGPMIPSDDGTVFRVEGSGRFWWKHSSNQCWINGFHYPASDIVALAAAPTLKQGVEA